MPQENEKRNDVKKEIRNPFSSEKGKLKTKLFFDEHSLYFSTTCFVTTPLQAKKKRYPPQSRTQSLQAFWSARQRREDSGDIEFYYRRISAVKQWKPLRNSQSKKLNFFDVPRVFPALPR